MNMNNIAKISFVLMISLSGQASNTIFGYTIGLTPEEEKYVSLAKDGNLAELSKFDVETIREGAAFSALCEAVKSKSLPTVKYLLSTYKSHRIPEILRKDDVLDPEMRNLLIQHEQERKDERWETARIFIGVGVVLLFSLSSALIYMCSLNKREQMQFMFNLKRRMPCVRWLERAHLDHQARLGR